MEQKYDKEYYKGRKEELEVHHILQVKKQKDLGKSQQKDGLIAAICGIGTLAYICTVSRGLYFNTSDMDKNFLYYLGVNLIPFLGSTGFFSHIWYGINKLVKGIRVGKKIEEIEDDLKVVEEMLKRKEAEKTENERAR